MSWARDYGVTIGLAQARRKLEDRVNQQGAATVGGEVWLSEREARVAVSALRLDEQHLQAALDSNRANGRQEVTTALAERYHEARTLRERLEDVLQDVAP